MRNFCQWFRNLIGSPVITAPTTPNPDYIDYANDYIIPIPGMADDTWLYCFPIKGTYRQMLEVVNQRLNFSPLNKQIRYFPLSDSMMMVVSDIRKGYTLDPNYKKYGYLAEKGIQFFMPLVECLQDGNKGWKAERLAFFIPYIAVDQPYNVAIGREELGYPKVMGRIDMPILPQNADNFNVDVYGFKQFNKANPEFGQFHSFLNIKKINGTVPEGQWHNHQEAWTHIKEHIAPPTADQHIEWGLPFVVHELEDVVARKLPLVFLKQFRDITNPSKACYQALTQGNGFTENFLGGWFLGGEYGVTINDLASFPICADLGIANNFTVSHPFWIHANLKFETGTVLWRAD